MTFPGPDLLGRGVVVGEGSPSPLQTARRVLIDRSVLVGPQALEETVERLHRLWVERRSVTVELGVEASELQRPVAEDRAPWMLGPGYVPLLERLHFLVWANNWDGRRGDPIWWWSRKAERLGARIGGRADVVTPQGEHAWVDGGPRSPLDVPVIHAQTVEAGRLALQPPATVSGADLAGDQREAVEHRAGPVRVIAPAGSGKTRTLGARLLHLIDDRRVEPRFVTAVAYNNRAAREMRERLQREDLHIRTIHSLGWAIIREVRPDATLLTEREVRSRLGAFIPKQPRPNTDVTGPYLEGLAEIMIALRDPDEVEGSRTDIEGLARIFPMYRALLARRNEVDYNEQIYGAIELLLADPELRKRWQRRCRHLLVDEFQDLTPAYLLLLRLLASPEMSVFGVGDDDQTIYGYAGADPRFLIEFGGYFPGAGASALTVNYRCPTGVVTAASRLLSHNRIRVPKTIEAFGDSAKGGFRVITPERRQMAVEPAAIVGKWVEEGASPEDIAVLARVNSALLPMLAALGRAGIPFRSQLDAGLLERTTMRAALAWIRLALAPDSMSRRDLLEAVRRPARRINRLASELIPEGHTSIRELAGLGRGLDERKAATWRRFVEAIEDGAQVAARGNSGLLLDYLSGEVGLGRVAHSLDSKRGRADRSTHTDDLVALRRTAAVYEDLPTFETELRRLLDRGPSPPVGVTATSVHRVKGLEWDRVIVFGVDRGLMPHVLAEDVEEERRVLHVAITRCRREVVVVAERGRESPFIRELNRNYRPAPVGIPTLRTAPHPGGPVALEPEPRGDGPESPAPGSAGVDEPYDAALYEALREWRLEAARDSGVAAFVVFPNRTLEEIARRRPRSEAELLAVRGVGPSKLARYGGDVLAIVASAGTDKTDRADDPPITPPQPGPDATTPDPPRRPSSEDSALLDALREWRAAAARREQVPAYVISRNETLEEISRLRPRTEAELLGVRGMGPARLARYGRDILELVESNPPA
ncbi:MAG: ATP-dependent DNA helicase UvrD2 [bacterium]|nr:ATP-dependent DNA helicase UvrD2 [bacterium]